MNQETGAALAVDVLAEIARLIREVIGEDWADEAEIALHTSFNADLELESIEMVALAERVQDRWGETVDFAGWLSQLELDAIIALTVGDLVGFVESCQS